MTNIQKDNKSVGKVPNRGKSTTPRLRFSDFNKEWKLKNGNEIFDNISNKKHNSHLPILSITQEHGAIPRELIDYKISVTDKSIESYKVVNKGDFIISLRSFQGGIEYSEYDGICSPAYIILKPKIIIIDKFFKFYLKTPSYITSLNKNLDGIRDGKMISYKYFSETTLPFPTIEEQNKIAIFFDLIETRIQTQNKIIEQLETLIKDFRNQIFEQKLRFTKFKYDWKEKSLNEIAKFYSGGTPLTSKKEFFDGKIPFIRSGEINSNKTEQFISELGLKNSSAKMIEVGDILYALYGATSGEVGISKIKGAINQAVLCIKSTENHYFIYSYLLHKKESIISTYLQGGQGNLSAEIVKQIKISIPSAQEQNKIASFLSKIDQKIQTEKTILEQLEMQKKYLLQQMFV